MVFFCMEFNLGSSTLIEVGGFSFRNGYSHAIIDSLKCPMRIKAAIVRTIRPPCKHAGIIVAPFTNFDCEPVQPFFVQSGSASLIAASMLLASSFEVIFNTSLAMFLVLFSSDERHLPPLTWTSIPSRPLR